MAEMIRYKSLTEKFAKRNTQSKTGSYYIAFNYDEVEKYLEKPIQSSDRDVLEPIHE